MPNAPRYAFALTIGRPKVANGAPVRMRIERKLGYTVYLPRWGWMLGTGIYLDDVDAA